jgi:hypothetical protein
MARYTPITAGKVQSSEDEQEPEDNDAESEDEDDTEEARFATVATPVVQKNHSRTTEAASTYRSPEIQRIFGSGAIFSR